MPPTQASHVWAYDVVFDMCANGQPLKFLAIDVAGGMRSRRVIEFLAPLVTTHGAPAFLRSDHGHEFVSRAILEWLQVAGIATALNDPGTPWQNGTDDSFNGTFRDECLSLEWFRNRIDAKWVTGQWRREYNDVRPHSILGDLTPAEFKSQPQIKSGCLTEGSTGSVLQ